METQQVARHLEPFGAPALGLKALILDCRHDLKRHYYSYLARVMIYARFVWGSRLRRPNEARAVTPDSARGQFSNLARPAKLTSNHPNSLG